ncbi:dihydrofolate reductase family protein [Microbacterium sp. ASV81]|uniref:Dihydrofolate reductase family protein n=1 Tax=Microbacterium capsulatum TaxID=3041921 RepID=A0ABU0XI81_9MICO|nr:dihydrofolate reductase family protein [Microbacterium sp. ASV81]MDQ4214843.1 dihydrofolate reductase family protein [Microbacterium sp. ASV81]
MQTLTIDFICSLDGYGAAEGWPGLWGMGGPDYFEWLNTAIDKDAPILMGATTYRLMSALAAGGEEGTDVLNAIPKYVFSSTLEDPLTWENSILVREDAVTFVRRLKEESDRPLRTLGSVALCRALLNAGLVDRYRVVLFPVITGATGSDRIFDGYPDVRLELVESRTFDHRLQLLEYVPTVLDGPPGRDGSISS